MLAYLGSMQTHFQFSSLSISGGNLSSDGYVHCRQCCADAGTVLASLAGGLLAILLWVCCWQQKCFATKSSKVAPSTLSFKTVWPTRKQPKAASTVDTEVQTSTVSLHAAPSAASDLDLLANQLKLTSY